MTDIIGIHWHEDADSIVTLTIDDPRFTFPVFFLVYLLLFALMIFELFFSFLHDYAQHRPRKAYCSLNQIAI